MDHALLPGEAGPNRDGHLDAHELDGIPAAFPKEVEGVALLDGSGGLIVSRKAGRVANLEAALDEAGIGPETLSALSLIPLVAVAWADGKLDDGEREAIERAANEARIADPARAMLQSWLAAPPESELLETWKEYIGAVRENLSEEARKELRQNLVGGARVVAEAAGGFLGFGNKISDSEAVILDELDACFDL